MAKYITSTNTFTIAKVKGVNPKTEEFSELTKKLFGEPTETEVLIAFCSDAFMPMRVLESSAKTEKRRMLFEKFITNSKPLSDETKKEKGRFILRTVKSTVASVRCLDIETETITSKVFTLQGELNETDIILESRLQAPNGILPFKVTSYNVVEEKRRIHFDKWMELSETCGEETADSE